MAGAPALAGVGALRAGAGLVRVAVPAPIQAAIGAHRPELLVPALPASSSGALGASALREVLRLAQDADVVVLGPGLGRAKVTQTLVRRLVGALEVPLLLDADALFALAGRLAEVKRRRAPTVLTPHEGEAARLLGVEAVRDRARTARRLAVESGAVAVLKGPGTLVCDGKRLVQSPLGGPVLASAGTGDVLAGAIAALLAQGHASRILAFDAAVLGVWAHARAAEIVAGPIDRGVLALDVADGLPDALHERTGRR
jgi:NAD(P)H-hydrate epimerase